jgi:hypothetical protein
MNWPTAHQQQPTFATKSEDSGQIAHSTETTLCAMCGRLRFGKSFLHGFAALVVAAMCSAF